MNTQQVAKEFTELCKQGKLDEAGAKFWGKDVVSLEPHPGEMSRAQGLEALAKKGEWWTANHEVHGFTTKGPYVHGDQFSLVFGMDVTAKVGPQAGQRIQMDEVALYTVKDGKIVEERFFY